MRRTIVVIGIVLLMVSATAFGQETYDSSVTVPIMRANGQALGQLRTAAANSDFLTAAGALATIAQGSLTLLGYEPPKGSEDDWVRIHTELVEAALRGIVACSAEDADGLAQAVGAMRSFSGTGHGQFR